MTVKALTQSHFVAIPAVPNPRHPRLSACGVTPSEFCVALAVLWLIGAHQQIHQEPLTACRNWRPIKIRNGFTMTRLSITSSHG